MQIMQTKDNRKEMDPLLTFDKENTLLQRIRVKKWMTPNKQINIIGHKHWETRSTQASL